MNKQPAVTWENMSLLVDETIGEFKGDFAFLSNFYELGNPIPASWGEGALVRYVPTTEHAYQAGKARLPDEFVWVCQSNTPDTSKRRGKQVKIRESFEANKVSHMLHCVRLKFKVNPELAQRLLDTKDVLLIEGNNWGDQFWGVTLKDGVGKNVLGEILMLVRDELRCERSARELAGFGTRPYT